MGLSSLEKFRHPFRREAIFPLFAGQNRENRPVTGEFAPSPRRCLALTAAVLRPAAEPKPVSDPASALAIAPIAGPWLGDGHGPTPIRICI